MSRTNATVRILPAPTGGWNTRDPLTAMPEGDAQRLVNVFPEQGKCVLRKGCRWHSDTETASPVESLFEYNNTDGTSKLIAASDGEIWNCSSFQVSPTSLDSGFTSNKWQAVNFRNSLIMVNGADTPQNYNGSTVADAVYTGSGLTATNLVNVSVYKERLYFVEKNSANIWYGGVSNITGALTKLDVGSQLKKGGQVVYAGSWSRDTGRGLTDLFIIVSNKGEVLAYDGDYPASSNWGITGRFYVSEPLGNPKYRSFAFLNADLIIITETGLYPLSKIFTDTLALASNNSLASKINKAFVDVAQNYSSNFGWEACSFPGNNYAIINIPLQSSTTSEQYIVNMLSGSWAKFTGWNAQTFTTFNKKLYYGGIDGKVYEANYGYNDNEAPIDWEIKWSPSYLGADTNIKRVLETKPLIASDGNIAYGLSCDPDFQDAPLSAVLSTATTGAEWDTAEWDTSTWGDAVQYNKNWYATPAVGYLLSHKLKGSTKNAYFELFGLAVNFEYGGVK